MTTTPLSSVLRRLRGDLSRRELARRAGVHRETIAAVEAGESVTIASLRAILTPLGAGLAVEDAAGQITRICL